MSVPNSDSEDCTLHHAVGPKATMEDVDDSLDCNGSKIEPAINMCGRSNGPKRKEILTVSKWSLGSQCHAFFALKDSRLSRIYNSMSTLITPATGTIG